MFQVQYKHQRGENILFIQFQRETVGDFIEKNTLRNDL